MANSDPGETNDELIPRSHPLRAALSDEMHLRVLPRFPTPARLMQIVTLTGEGSEVRAHAEALWAQAGATLPADVKFATTRLGPIELVWERHTEFVTYTLIKAGADECGFDVATFGETGRNVLESLPGEIVRATQVAVLGRDAQDPDPAWLDRHFSTENLVLCDVVGGKARLWSDFRLKPSGFGQLLVADRGLTADEPAQLIQRLQELGNYRNMALLGLPLAQSLAPQVTKLETRLAILTASVSERVSDDDQLLDELTYLSAELARIDSDTRYRMSATRAYSQISLERLASLRPSSIAGYQTLADFTERRLTPALRTCESFSARLDDLSRRASWTGSLLRTRVDTALAKQNRDLLESMDRRTRMQLRLQQAVEGLSVVAISYYLVALLGYVFAAIPGIDRELAMAIAAPAVFLSIFLLSRRLHGIREE